MVNIYCITDCNGLKYVGSTRQNIRHRLSNHTYHKKKNIRYCSSHKLDLDNCEIEVLETCNPEIRYEREKHYINTIDCVNEIKFTFDYKSYHKKWELDNKEKRKEQKKIYDKKRLSNRKEETALYDKKRKEYLYS